MTRLDVEIHGKDNWRGLSRDAEVLTAAFERLGHRVTYTRRVWTDDKGWVYPHRPTRRFDLAVLLEQPDASVMERARRSWLVPNIEFFDPNAELVASVDLLIAKTRTTADVMAANGLPFAYTGFTSPDVRYDLGLPRAGFLHLAGSSMMKNTVRVLDDWMSEPSWPQLTAAQYPQRFTRSWSGEHASNLVRISGVLSNQTRVVLQNLAAVHLQPSAIEGWGHVLGEGLSTGAIVVTLDAAPMNEIIRPDHGFLLPAQEYGRMGSAPLWSYRHEDLAEVVHELASMHPEEFRYRAQSSRQRFEHLCETFEHRLTDLVNDEVKLASQTR
jgi:hypothetical protein